MSDNRISRRSFVRRTAAGVAAGAGLAGLVSSHAEAKNENGSKTLNFNPKMGYRRFGKTGLMISEVSLGGHWKTHSGGRYWASFPGDNPPPDVQKNRNDMVVKCAELGINYLDITTPGEAAIYGRAMKQTGVKLHTGYSDHILCMRNPKNRTVKALMHEIDEGLRRLQTKQLFLWRPQALMGGGHSKEELDRVVETYEIAKKQGKVRFLGMSAHSHDFVHNVIRDYGDHYHAFVFMYTVSNKPKDSKSMFDILHEKDIGAIGLKPFHGNAYFRGIVREAKKAGKEPDLNTAAIKGLKKILEVPELTTTIPGLTLVAEAENDVKASYERKKKLTKADYEELDALVEASFDCLPPDYDWIRKQIYV